MGASARETCHAREREHPGCHDAARLAACATLDGFLATAHLDASSCPHGWVPAFAGMTRVGWLVECLLDRERRLASSDTARTDKDRTPCVDQLILRRGLSGTTSD